MSDHALGDVSRNFTHAAGRCRQVGFTLFELIVVIVIFSIMVGYLLTKALDYLEIAEKATMETQRMMMRAGMDLQIAGLVTAGRERDIPALARINPMDWLREKPANYLGAFAAAPAGPNADTGWYFDTRAGELVYLPKRHANLKPDLNGQFRIRFHVMLAAPGEPTAGSVRTAEWPRLVPVEPYVWF